MLHRSFARVASAAALLVVAVSGPASADHGYWPAVGTGFSMGCTAAGARRTATATLLKPLGDRAVLNVANGQPVPMTVLP